MRYVGTRQIVIDGQPTPTPHWEPDKSLEGQTVVIIGGGPSLATFDLNGLKGFRFIVVNSGCRRLRQVATEDDILYFTDNSWNENRPDLAADWPGPVITVNRNVKARLQDAVRYFDVVAMTNRIGAAPDHAQASSGHIAACLAADMGAKRLVLMAFECSPVGPRSHGHGDYTQDDASAYTQRFLPGWQGLKRHFDRMGVEVLNATPGGVLECFERVDW